MELQAAILLVVSFALLLMFSVPVSYSIVASAFITITAFLTPQYIYVTCSFIVIVILIMFRYKDDDLTDILHSSKTKS